MNLLGLLNPKSSLAKGVFAVLAFLFFFGATVFLFGRKNPETALQEKIEKLVPLTAEEKTLVSQKLQELSRDSDNDGLKDWEEIIYRTNPQIADTDNDGTKDGEEIKQNRDPLVRGPKDSNETPKNEVSSEPVLDVKNNLTHKFINDLYSGIGPSVSADGVKINEPTIKSLASKMDWVNPETILETIPAAVKKTDLIVSSKNDPESIRKYFNTILDAYVSSGSGLTESDFSILERVLKEKNFNELKKLDTVIAATSEALNKIKKIPAPSGYEDFAVNELNYLGRIIYLIENFKNAENDPTQVLAMFQARLKILSDVTNYRKETGKELASKGITFAREEGGYALLQLFQ